MLSINPKTAATSSKALNEAPFAYNGFYRFWDTWAAQLLRQEGKHYQESIIRQDKIGKVGFTDMGEYVEL